MTLANTVKCKCKECGQLFYPEMVEDEETGDEYFLSETLCSWCFESAIEDFEERKREHIARDNEY